MAAHLNAESLIVVVTEMILNCGPRQYLFRNNSLYNFYKSSIFLVGPGTDQTGEFVLQPDRGNPINQSIFYFMSVHIQVILDPPKSTQKAYNYYFY